MTSRPARSAPKQTRSQKRVDLILDTAAEFFAEVGYEAATTNAIAERAGISIGSLYRYFPDKETLLRAWATRYGEQICALYDQAFADNVPALPLPALLDHLIDPFLELYLACPVYTHILLGADVSPEIAAVNKALEAEIIERTADVFRCVAPQLTEARARLTATVCKASVKGLISLVTVSHDKKFRAQVTAETKRMLAAYLEPILREIEPA
jgi:AcrR family transcriptional regulator